MIFYSSFGMQTQSSAGSPHPLHTPSSIGAPHTSQGEHPHVWHMVFLRSYIAFLDYQKIRLSGKFRALRFS